MTSFLQKNIDEIQSDNSLSFYGLALSLTHVWTYFYWNKNNFFINSQSGINAEPICFPWFPNCDLFRQAISMESWSLVLYSYLVLACLSVGFFSYQRTLKAGYFLLAITTLVKFALHMSNYNFMGNYHYMIYLVLLTYLFLPHKKQIIKYLVVLFYLSAGFLKINIDWLSGAAMIRSPYIGGPLLVFSLFYVVLLELVLVFGLIHRNKWFRWFVLLQFVGFHAFSWHIVGFFYPMVMFCILSLFFFDEWRYHQQNKPAPDLLAASYSGGLPKVVYIVVIGFSLLQLSPFLLASDPSLSGAPRLASLNMFDSKTECHHLLVAKTNQGTLHLKRPMKNLGVRLKCDPIVYLNQAHQICRKNRESQEIERLSLTLFTKRVTQQKFVKVLDIKDVCALGNPLWAEVFGGSES